jgi:AcrR family transcriptional regulator
VAAALELLGERDDIDISLQDVVDRSKMSIRTFYAYFDSKESLLLAVYETIMSRMVVPVLRERCDSEPDPVLRVKALLEAILELTAAKAGPVSRALSVFHHRLAETRHDDLDHAMEPLRRLITDLLTDVAAAGHLRDDLDPPTLVALLQEFVLATAHTAVFAGGRPATRLEARWAFCSAAILRHNEPMAGTQPVSDARSTAVHAMQPAFQGPAR